MRKGVGVKMGFLFFLMNIIGYWVIFLLILDSVDYF